MKVRPAKTQVVRPTPYAEQSDRATMTLAPSGYTGAAPDAAWVIATSEDVSKNYYSGYANWYYDWGSGGVNDVGWESLPRLLLGEYRYIWTSTNYGLTNFNPSNVSSAGARMGATNALMPGGEGALEIGIRINNVANFFGPESTYQIDDTGAAPVPNLYSTTCGFPAVGESSLLVLDEIIAANYAGIAAVTGELYISGLAWKWSVSKTLNTYTAGWEPTRSKQSFYIW